MKKFSAIIILLLSGFIIRGESFDLAPGGSTRITVDAPAKSLLKVRARLDLPAGKEGWGGYFMGLALNGKQPGMPVNTGAKIWDLTRVPPEGAEHYSSSRNAWFVKADSDFIAFNGEGSFDRTGFLGRKNTVYDRSGYTNAYYDKIFEIGTGTAVLEIRNLSPRYRLTGNVEVMDLPHGELLFFVPVAGKDIYPWSFPQPEEMKRELSIRACSGEFEPLVLSVRNRGGDLSFRWRLEGLPFAPDIRVQGYAGPDSTDRFKYVEAAGLEVVQPDRLLASDEWKVPAGQTGSLWMIFHIPADAAPGSHQGKLILNDAYEFPVKVEVLPFKLAPAEKIYGLWTNSLPGRDPERRRRQCADLRGHGINTFFLDQWTTPVSITPDGGIDISRFEAALAWLKEENLNRKALIFGLIGSLPKQISAAAKTEDVRSPEWAKTAERLFSTMEKAAAKEGFEFYLHSHDEPDIHPKITADFESLSRSLKQNTSIKIASNATIVGQMHWSGMIDLNICAVYNGVLQGWNGEAGSNHFFPQWGRVSPEDIRKHVKYGYTQVRASDAVGARSVYGLLMDAMNLHGMWGFAYYWGKDDWNIAWPFPEKDGRWGTTFGWEMLRAGVNDSRYYRTLRLSGGEFELPEPGVLHGMTMEELQSLRDQIIDRILKRR